jgi:ribosome-binding factor A
MIMNNYRAQKIGVLIRNLISEMIVRKIKDPRVGLATITEVEVESNLRIARVYYSVQGDEKRRQLVGQGLKSAKGYIKRELARALGIRFMPDLIFEFDSSLIRSQRLKDLLNGKPQDLHTGKADG